MKMLSWFAICALMGVSALCFNACARAEAVKQAADKPAVLFVADRGQAKPHLLRTWHDWIESGYNIDVKDISKIRSLKDLSAFNTVVVNFLPMVDGNKNVVSDQILFEKILDQYLKQGGGVVVFCGGGQYGLMKPALDHLLKPYGAMVPEEQIVDKTNTMGHCHEGRYLCNFTTQIAEAPMTRGVKKIGYIGQASRADVMKLMMPVVITDETEWNVVLRGEKEAYSAGGKHPGDGSQIKDTPDSYAEYPVMAAWRNVGKGRLFLFPHNACQTVTTPDIFDNFFWKAGDTLRDDVPDNRTFIMQTVDWAGEPSLQEGTFGGFKTDQNINPFAGAILSKKNKPAINWAEIGPVEKLAPGMGSLKGVIGAQSVFSGGKFTVTQLADAAREAGLDFIAFTEKLEELTPEKWGGLLEECDRISDEKFLAVPGLWALDKVGNRFFGIGEAPYPTPTAVTKDGKRLDNLAQFWFKLFGSRMVGFANVNQNPNPWFELRKSSGMALYTYEGGKRVDQAEQAFGKSSYNMENYLPFSVAVVATPEDVKAASRQMVNVFTGGTLQDLSDYIYGNNRFERRLFWETHHHWNLSSGPRLEYHGGHNVSSLATDEENENIYRYGFKLSNLDRGDEILLMDGPRVFRKWIADENSFSIDKTWAHEQVRVFIVKVVRRGETVFVSSPMPHNYGRRFYSCGDRQNSLPVNFQPDKKGDWYVSGVPLAAAYKSWDPNTLVYSPEPIYLIGAVGIEAVPTYLSSWLTGPDIPFDHPRIERAKSLSSTHFHSMSCPGVIITDNIAKRVYPNGGSHLGDQRPPLKTEPLELFNYTVRHYGLYGMQGQLNGQVTESKITALQDVAMEPGKSEVKVVYKNHPFRANVDYYIESQVGAKTSRYALADGGNQRVKTKVYRGDYVGTYPNGLNRGGAHYVVSGDLSSTIHMNKGRASSFLSLNVPPVWVKDQTFEYSVLFSNGGSMPVEETSDYARIKEFLGFNGPHPAIKKITGGKLLSKPVIATIETKQDSVVRINTVKNEKDPMGLTVRLTGYNPNWQTVYRLNGSRKWRYLGELDGYFYFNLYTNMRDHTVMAGHPVLADNPRVIIALEDPAGAQSSFELYNPTDAAVTVTVRTNPEFYKPWSREVRLQPFESKRVKVESDPVF